MKKRFLTTIIVAFALAVIMMPGTGFASVNVQGLAYMTWNSPAFEGSVNWLDPGGADTRGSFGATAVTLNGVYEPYETGEVDGAPWATSGLSKTLADSTGSAYGSGVNEPSLGVQEALSSIAIGGYSTASVDIAQAVLSGQFTVAATMTLNILADYLLQMSLFNSNIGESSYVDVLAELTLENFDTGEALTSASSQIQSLSLIDAGTQSFTYNFQSQGYAPLSLTWDLVPGITYDFRADVSTVAYATSVPEPMSILLLLSGIAGLAIFRKQFA